MKAILEFDLDTEREDFITAIHGADFRSVLWDLEQWLRNKVKYEEISGEHAELYQGVRNKITELLGDIEL